MTFDALTDVDKLVKSSIAGARCQRYTNVSSFLICSIEVVCYDGIQLFTFFVKSNVISNVLTDGLLIS